MRNVISDLRYTIRQLCKSPVFTIAKRLTRIKGLLTFKSAD
jgi:hypothetical protein